MAFEFTNRKSFVPADIRVNRGDVARQGARQISASGFQLSDTIRKYAEDQTTLTKAYEEKRAKKLAAGVEILFDDVTYTGADGIERTRQIAKGYKTPENLIGTSWAAVTFDEEAAKVYTEQAIATANTILNEEKLISKEQSTFTMTPVEVTTMFDANIQEPLDKLRDTIPDEMKAIFELGVKKNVESVRTKIANEQLTKVKNYNIAYMNNKFNNYEAMFGSYFAGDPDEGLQKLDELKEEAEYKQMKNVPSAHIWVNSLYPQYKNMLEAGKEINKFINIDYEDTDSLATAHSNIKGIEILFNLQSQKVPLINANGEVENITLKDFGIDGQDNQIARSKILTTLSKHRTLINDLFTTSKNDDVLFQYIKESDYGKAYKGDPMYTDPNILHSRKNFIHATKAIDTPGHKIHDMLLPKFIVENKLENQNYNKDNILSSAIANEYRQYVIANYNIIGSKSLSAIQSDVNRLANLKGKDKDRKNVLAEKSKIIDMLQSQGFLNLMAARAKTEQGTTIPTGILNTIPESLLNEAEKNVLRNLVMASRNSTSVEAAADLYIEGFIAEPLVNDKYFRETYGESIGAIQNKIDEVILSEYSDVNFAADNIIAHNFRRHITNRVLDRLTQLKQNVTDVTIDEVNNMVQDLDYGFSEYAYAFTGATDDPDEIDFDKGKVFTKWTTDRFFTTHPSRLPKDYDIVYDPLLASAIYDENYLLHLEEFGQTGSTKRKSLEKTPLYYEIQNEIRSKVESHNKVSNKQFQIEEELVLGENLKLVEIGDSPVEAGVMYQFVYLPNKEGVSPIALVDELQNNVQISRLELMQRSNDSNTNIDKHVKGNIGIGEIFERSFEMARKLAGVPYKGSSVKPQLQPIVTPDEDE